MYPLLQTFLEVKNSLVYSHFNKKSLTFHRHIWENDMF